MGGGASSRANSNDALEDGAIVRQEKTKAILDAFYDLNMPDKYDEVDMHLEDFEDDEYGLFLMMQETYVY